MTYKIVIPGTIFIILALLFGCSSVNLKLKPTGGDSAVVSYNQGASVDATGAIDSIQMMKEFCKPKVYKVINTTYSTAGEDRFRVETEFICIKKQQDE
jgi:hypothetical protein